MTSYFLGCDPGVSGAIAVIRNDSFVMLCEDFTSFRKHYEQLKDLEINLAFIEDVHIWAGSGAKSSTTFMKNAGGWLSLLEILNVKHLLESPQTWQKKIIGTIPKPATKGLEKKDADRIKREHKKAIKLRSVQTANRFFGLDLSSGDDGKADALNMALYAMKYHMNQL